MTARRRIATLLTLAAVLLTLAAPPASGDNHDQPLVVTIENPSANATLTRETVSVSGHVQVRDINLLGAEIDRITVTLVRASDGSPVASADACAPCGRAEPQQRVTFSTGTDVSANGRYRAEVVAIGRGLVGLSELRGTGSRTFGVAARPRAPQDVKVEVISPGLVGVSWARNTEPDMLHYEVERKGPGGDSFTTVAKEVKQPASGPRVLFPDATGPTGGDYSYRIVAVRQGVDEPLRSAPSGDVTVAVTPVDPGAPGGLPTGASEAISAFLASQPGSSVPRPPRPRVEAPDTGFSQSLPFGARPPGEELEEGEEEAEPRSFEVVTPRTEFVSRGRPLVPIAAGAILLLLAMHLRLLNRRVKAAASPPAVVSGPAHTDLTPLDLPVDEPPLDVAAVPEPPGPLPSSGPPPRATLFDYEEMVGNDDDAWADRRWDDDEIREAAVYSGR